MTILFASNSAVDFLATDAPDTTAGRFRATHVGHGFTCSGDEVDKFATVTVEHAAVSGTSTWIHCKIWHNNGLGGNNATGDFWFRCIDAQGRTLFYFTTSGVSGNQLWVTGDTNVLDGIGQGTPWATGTIQDFDVHVDLSGNNIAVNVYLDKSSTATFSATAANTNGKTNPVVQRWRCFDWLNITHVARQTISEYIIADVDTRGMGYTDLLTLGVGNYAEWTGDVADISDGSVESGLTADVVNKKVTLNVSAYGGPAGVVLGIFLSAHGGVSGAVGDLRGIARKGTTDFFSAGVNANAGRPKPNLMKFLTNPDTTNAWATTEFVDFEFGVESVA